MREVMGGENLFSLLWLYQVVSCEFFYDFQLFGTIDW